MDVISYYFTKKDKILYNYALNRSVRKGVFFYLILGERSKICIPFLCILSLVGWIVARGDWHYFLCAALFAIADAIYEVAKTIWRFK